MQPKRKRGHLTRTEEQGFALKSVKTFSLWGTHFPCMPGLAEFQSGLLRQEGLLEL